MALSDDLNQLAQQEVVYLSRILLATGTGGGTGSTTIFRGRLHQALNGNWVFNTSTGQNGVAGIDLGQLGPNWSSSNTPAGGLLINISNQILSGTVSLYEGINLMSVIPEDLAD
jgi:hypothetical protein